MREAEHLYFLRPLVGFNRCEAAITRTLVWVAEAQVDALELIQI